MDQTRDHRQSPEAVSLSLWLALVAAVLMALPLVPSVAQDQAPPTPAQQAPPAPAAQAQEVQAEEETPARPPAAAVPLAPGLPAELLPPEPGTRAADRLETPLAEALSDIEPAEFGDAPAEAGALAPEAARGVEAALGLLAEGRSFEALGRLREAERLAPGHPRVVRALGLAYVSGGNSVRARGYLERAAAMDPADTDVRVQLTRLALDRRDWPRVLSLAASVDAAARQADTPDPPASLFADYARAVALDRLDYASAAGELYERVLAAQAQPDADSAAGREWYILSRQRDALRQRVGDLYLRRGERALARAAYRQADPAQLVAPAELVARLAYTTLASGLPGEAADDVVGFLATPAATEHDTALVAYLLRQGADPAALDAQLAAAADSAPPSHFPLVAARAVVLPQSRTVELIDAWLADQPPRLSSFRRAIALLRGGEGQPDDPAALAHALALTAQQMQRQPQRELDYAMALLDQPIDPVALIRALRTPAIDHDQDPGQVLLNALAYTKVGRAGDARTMYQRVLENQPDHPEATLGLARALMMLGRLDPDPDHYDQARQLLGTVNADADWPRFELYVNLLAETQRLRQARNITLSRVRAGGSEPELLLLAARIEFLSTNFDDAILILRRLLAANPTDERVYDDAANLFFPLHDLVDLPQLDAFAQELRDRLNTHLPKSRTARVHQARTLFKDQQRPELALPILEGLLAENPEDWGVLHLLHSIYQETDRPDAARAVLGRLIEMMPPGIERTRQWVSYHTGHDAERVAQVVRETLAHAEEDVLPGPPLTGDDVSGLLYRLTLAVGDAAAEPDYLRAIRRFPDSPALNNALGYTWAMAGKELLAAEAMIERAIELSPREVATFLDSLAWVNYKMGRFAQAEALMRRAITLHRAEQRAEEDEAKDRGLDAAALAAIQARGTASKAVYYDHMGDILYQQGEVRSATRHWVIAGGLRIDPAEAAISPEAATVIERCDAKVAAVNDGLEPPVADVPGQPAFGSGIHPAERAP